MKKSITLSVILCIALLVHAQNSKTVNLTTAGTLSTVLSSEEIRNLTCLIITGQIDVRDFFTMRDSMLLLSEIDISKAYIEDYSFNYYTNYAANTVPACAFIDKKTLNSISLPLTLVSIDNCAFENCTGLSTIEIPVNKSDNNAHIYIGGWAFSGCKNLTSVILPKRVFMFPSSFMGCSGLKTLTSPFCYNEFSNYFSDSPNLETVIIPEGAQSIGYRAFYNMPSLKNVYIPASVLGIDIEAFYGCSGLTNVTTPFGNDDWNRYGNFLNVFPDSKNLRSITIPEGTISIRANAFSDNFKNVTSITIPKSVKYIGNEAFKNCVGMSNNLIDLSNLDSIGESAFYGCSNLKGILKLPLSITKIESYAFSDCSSLTGDLNIPLNVTYIGSYAFKGCSNLNGILTIPSSIASIGAAAFSGCSNLKGKITLPQQDTSLEYSIFKDCSSLSGSLTIPSTVKYIGSDAFKNCKGLTGELIIPQSVLEISYDAFYGCSGFTGTLIIPAAVNYLGRSVFEGCNGFSGALTIPATTSIGGYAFKDCIGFTSAITPYGNRMYSSTDIKPIFLGCTSLKTISIPEGVNSIVSNAFSNNFSNITSITLPTTLTSIGEKAFLGCSGLTKISIPETVIAIGSYAFAGCIFMNEIYANAKVPVYLRNSDYVFDGINTEICKLYVPTGSLSVYKTAYQWKDFFNIVELNTVLSNASNKSLSIYPNVVSQGFVLSGIDDQSLISLFNLNGVILLSKYVNNNEYININDIPAGIYIAIIKHKNGSRYEQKIIKM